MTNLNEFIYRVNQILLSCKIGHVCWQESTRDKRPVIDIIMFLQKSKQFETQRHNEISKKLSFKKSKQGHVRSRN